MKIILTIVLFFSLLIPAHAQEDINLLIKKAKQKVEAVNDYVASGTMKTDVVFLKIPVASVKVYFKKPNKLKIKSAQGISFIPKGAVSINMADILADNKFTVIDAGTDKIGNIKVRIAKLLPLDDNSDVVLSTLYIDEATSLIYKAKTTTKENGSFEVEMTYGNYAAYALPDKIIFSFNTKDYKLPKGMTFDFDDGSKPTATDKTKNKKGKAELTFSNYVINKGVADDIFKQ